MISTPICYQAAPLIILVALIFSEYSNAINSDGHAESPTCPSLDGIYSYGGQPYGSHGGALIEPRLTAVAFGKTSFTDTVNAIKIKQDQTSKKLYVEVIGELFHNEDYTEFTQKYACVKNNLVLTRKEKVNSGGTITFADITIVLWKETDNALIVHSLSDIETTNFLIFKSNRFIESFYRFPKLKRLE